VRFTPPTCTESESVLARHGCLTQGIIVPFAYFLIEDCKEGRPWDAATFFAAFVMCFLLSIIVASYLVKLKLENGRTSINRLPTVTSFLCRTNSECVLILTFRRGWLCLRRVGESSWLLPTTTPSCARRFHRQAPNPCRIELLKSTSL
jgi:hypothetical protein